MQLTVLRKSLTMTQPGGRPIKLPVLRITALMRFSGQREWSDCWLDTGSPFTVIGERHWRAFEGEVDWLADPPPGAGELTRVAGAAYPYRLRRVAAELLGSGDTRPTDLGTVVALMLTDGFRLPAPLLGLWGGVLAGRRLVVEPDLASARLEAA